MLCTTAKDSPGGISSGALILTTKVSGPTFADFGRMERIIGTGGIMHSSHSVDLAVMAREPPLGEGVPPNVTHVPH